MALISSTTSITNLESLRSGIEQWVSTVKSSASATDTVARLVFKIEMTKPIIPPIITKTDVMIDGVLHEKTETADRKWKEITSEFPKSFIDNFSFINEYTSILKFVEDSSAFSVTVDSSAFSTSGGTLDSKTFTVKKP